MVVKRVTASEALVLQRAGYILVDIRPPEDFQRGHPEGSRNVPYYFYTAVGDVRPNLEFVSIMSALFPHDARLVLVDKVGKRSPKALEQLMQAGFTEVCDLRAGYKGILDATGRHLESGWETLGLPGTRSDDASYAQAVADAKAALRKR